ncbi:MAG: hypothetical protein QXT38_03095 [Candidatus Aenigmatarchaeota archaeon]
MSHQYPLINCLLRKSALIPTKFSEIKTYGDKLNQTANIIPGRMNSERPPKTKKLTKIAIQMKERSLFHPFLNESTIPIFSSLSLTAKIKAAWDQGATIIIAIVSDRKKITKIINIYINYWKNRKKKVNNRRRNHYS